MRHFLGLFSALAIAGVSQLAAQNPHANDNALDAVEKVEHRTNDNGAKARSGGVVPITYHNGAVILGGTHVYYIWYGGWTTSGSAGYDPYAATILNTLATHIGGSSYFNINTTYYSGTTNKTYITNAVSLSGSCTDNYSQGANLNDRAIGTIVGNAIKNCFGNQPDAQGVYFVLTSKDVRENSGFCSQYCGWHTYGTMNGVNVKYAFIGDSAACLNACSMFGSQTGWKAPNGDPGADGMASIIAHELEESTTDPLLNAWYDSTGAENADKCAWTFGTVTQTSTASYNVNLGLNFLIQQNWVNNATPSLQGCAMAH